MKKIDRDTYFKILLFTIVFFNAVRWIVARSLIQQNRDSIYLFINCLFIVSLIAVLCFGYLCARENVLKLFISYSTTVLIIEIMYFFVKSISAPGNWGAYMIIAQLLYFIAPIMSDLSNMILVLSVTGAFLLASITLSIIFAINNRKRQNIEAITDEQNYASNEEKGD